MFSLKPPVRGRKEKMMGFTSRELLEYLANCFFGGTSRIYAMGFSALAVLYNSQMTITPLADGDAVVEAVHESVNGPTLGLCSASKLDNSKQSMGESGMDIAWVTGLQPYTAQDAAAYSYVVSGCDNPAGARLFIKFMMGGDDGQSGCYNVFDKLGHWSVRDDVTYKKSGITYEEALD